jgi:8-oxo-dGTP pyrophosphatase MutT (NUDIX family)
LSKETERYTAAGGVIARKELVLVLRWPKRNEVRLPKGHVEPGETVREAALREAREETGYLHLDIVADLGRQRVTFEDQGRRVMRTERYYLMTVPEGRAEPRGEAEAKFDPVWVGWEQALELLTFGAEREWVRRAKRLLDDHGGLSERDTPG